MSTRSYIGVKNPDETYRVIYCHYDGYPNHHAPILLNHYKTEASVRALLKLGSLSSLGEKIGQKHNFEIHGDFPEFKKMCLFYRRDRGDSYESTKAHTYAHAKYFADYHEYNYIFAEGQWWLMDAAGHLTDLRVAHVTEVLA